MYARTIDPIFDRAGLSIMSKDSFLFGIIGLLAGLIIGFMIANSINQNAAKTAVATPTGSSMPSNSNIPPGHPDIGGSTTGTGTTSSAGGMQPEVAAVIEKAKNSPDDYDAQVDAAMMYYRIKRFDEAIEHLTRANKLKPEEYETIVNLGNAYFDSDKYTDAEKYYSQALGKKPKDANVRTDLGLTFVFREPPDFDRAILEFQRALAEEPKHIQALQNITVAYIKKGDGEKAKASLAKLEETDPSNQALVQLKADVDKMGSK